MVSHHRQAIVEAPLADVWRLVGDPGTYPAWWPIVVEVNGVVLADGHEFIQVTKVPGGTVESTYLIDRYDDLRELRAHCTLSGSFVHWKLTEARDDTFVDIELGMDPAAKALKYRVMGRRYSRPLYRRWTDEALDSLRAALAR